MTYEPKVGDRIEITARGEVRKMLSSGDVWMVFDGSDLDTVISKKQLAQAKITRLEPELKEGPAVFLDGSGRVTIIALNEGWAWARRNDGHHGTYDATFLRNIPE